MRPVVPHSEFNGAVEEDSPAIYPSLSLSLSLSLFSVSSLPSYLSFSLPHRDTAFINLLHPPASSLFLFFSALSNRGLQWLPHDNNEEVQVNEALIRVLIEA